jgi:uncharacterized cysteine cluster protein YcgN (CxxCxxCC family)
MSENGTDSASWDNLCRQCGRCCFEKYEDARGKITYTQIPCRYLDVVSRRCKIFEQRFRINPSCVKLTPELVLKLAWLPRDCGYLSNAVEPSGTDKPSKRK